MALQPQKFRELVFQMLYSFDMGNSDEDTISDMLMGELKVTRKTTLQALVRTNKIRALQKELDKSIEAYSGEYTLNRIQTVEKSVLRLALFEMLYDDEIPPKVAISEAIRLAKKFSSFESTRFINGLLDSIYKDQPTDGTARTDEPPASEE